MKKRHIPCPKKSDAWAEFLKEKTYLNHDARRCLLPRLKKTVNSMFEILSQIDDYRQPGKVIYPIGDVLSLLIVACLGGCTDCTNAIKYLKNHEMELTALIGRPIGIPSKDQLCKILIKTDSEELREAFKKWIKHILKEKKHRHYAADGTMPRASGNKVMNYRPGYIQNVVDVLTDIVVDLVEVDRKSNEKKATLELLKDTDLTDIIVTVDAMNTTREIMKLCVGQGGDFVFPVKGNCRTLQADILDTFEAYYANGKPSSKEAEEMGLSEYTTIEENGGRIEKRTYQVSHDISGIDQEKYPDVKAIALVKRWVKEKKLNKKTGKYEDDISENTCCFIMSKPYSAKETSKIIRDHWKVESFHWLKDNYLLEDRSTNRKGNARINFAIIRRIAYNILSVLDKLLDELDSKSTLPEKLLFLNSNLHIAIQLVFGWDEEWTDRYQDYFQLMMEDLNDKEEQPLFYSC